MEETKEKKEREGNNGWKREMKMGGKGGARR